MQTNEQTVSENSRQISPQGLLLYKQMMDTTTFIKRQQWATTNYAVLIYAAILFLNDKQLSKSSNLSCALSTIAILTGLIAVGLLIRFQYDLQNLRKRVSEFELYSYGRLERVAFDIKKDEDPFTRGWHILAALILVCVIGAVLVLIALNK